MWMHKERVRMMGIDTLRIRTRDKVEKAFGLASKPAPRTVAHPIMGVPRQKSTRAEKIKKASLDEFWEIPSTIKEPLKYLLKTGHAVAYFGGSKRKRLKHMATREITT